MLVKHKTPTAEAFHAWMSEYPESFHPADTRRFFIFVKTAVAYGAKNWLNTRILKERIQKLKPKFDEETLDDLMSILENIKEYLSSPAIRVHEIDSFRKSEGTRDEFIEITVTDDGKRTERILDIKYW